MASRVDNIASNLSLANFSKATELKQRIWFTIGALVVFRFGQTAWYLYGMSREAHREKMPNHLLQWQAIRSALAQGCTRYDFWGAPDEFVESDPLWGVWKFKEGFGGQLVRQVGAWDYAPSRLAYRLYTRLLPRVLDLMRRRGRRQNLQAARGEPA